MVRRSVPMLVALAVTLSSAASCSDESASSGCINRAADAYNTMDLSGLTPADGFSESEYELFAERLEALLDADPELAEGGRCWRELDGKVLPEMGDRLDGDVQETLTAYGDALAADLNDSSS